ncbi:MAG: RnfABCDGE type electron transport complex subunit D [Clostridia bacterium]|nr:RnfABCDGE type electron transport complex subunit D [Clostridia bacterium]
MANNASKQNTTIKGSRIFGDYLVMLIAPCVVAVWYYGTGVLSVIAVSVLTALACDFAASALLGKNFRLKDFSNIFIGASIALMMPAGIPLYIPATAAAFAVVAVKIPFGGALHAPFVPSAAGFAFVSVCFKEQIFSYTVNTSDKFLGATSLGALLAKGSSVSLEGVNAVDILTGNVAGPMGTGCVLLMFGCCAYLFVRRRKALLATAGFVAMCALYAAVSPRINGSVFTSIVLELSAGSLLFAAVFLITDHATLPQNGVNRVIYGAVCGFFCMAMRSVGTYEETVCFAILFANGLRPVIDAAYNALPALFSKKKGGGR